MIVRILSENQYRVDEAHLAAITKLDDELQEAIHKDDHAHFHSLLSQLLALIQQHGQQVPDDELVTSDLIVPAPDMTLVEARKYLEASPS